MGCPSVKVQLPRYLKLLRWRSVQRVRDLLHDGTLVERLFFGNLFCMFPPVSDCAVNCCQTQMSTEQP